MNRKWKITYMKYGSYLTEIEVFSDLNNIQNSIMNIDSSFSSTQLISINPVAEITGDYRIAALESSIEKLTSVVENLLQQNEKLKEEIERISSPGTFYGKKFGL